MGWSELRKKYAGIVEKVYITLLGGREVAFATVFEFSENRKHEVLCLNLKKLHKTVVDKVEN